MIPLSAHKKHSHFRPYSVVAAFLGLFVTFSFLLFPNSCYACGEPGKDGPATPSGIINTYYGGVASVVSGANTITVGPARGGSPIVTIQPGDMVFIIQMQDAAINFSDTDAYGDGVGGEIGPQPKPFIPPPNAASGATNLNNTGLYEFNFAASAVGAAGGTLTLANPLLNIYTNASATVSAGQKRFQVVRVPQYASVTLLGTVTSAPWDGSSGGLVVFDVAGNMNFNNQTIDVSGQGFRGGYSLATAYENASDFIYRTENKNSGFKGEGIAGTPTSMWDTITNTNITGGSGYPGGNRGLGAPGNAGGGGSVDSAGGGGANGGAGGRGGDEYCPANPPQSSGSAPSICGFIPDRSHPDHTAGPYGGLGGRVASGALSTMRMIMGGGGGGGADHNSGSSTRRGGGRGGGMVILRAGTSTGTGTIRANGHNAPTPGAPQGNGGGGGAGGTILVVSGTSLSGLTIAANGGNGATNIIGHAPGGGGGGGVVYQSGGASVNISGGINGVRITNNPLGPLNTTSGESGTSGTSSSGGGGGGGGESSNSGAVCLPVLTVTKITTTPVRALTDLTANYVITVSNAIGKGIAAGVNIVDDLPAPFTYGGTPALLSYLGSATGPASPFTGTGTDPVSFGTAGGTPSFRIPGGGSVTLSFSVNLNSASGLFQNPANTFFLDPTRTAAGQIVTPGGVHQNGVAVGGSNYNSASSTGEDVQVGIIILPLTLTKSAVTFSDPINGITNPKAISGALMDYPLVLTNPMTSVVDTNTIFVTDAVPPNTALFVGAVGVGGSPVLFTDGAPTSGLTYTFVALGSTTDDLAFSNDGGITFTYTPVPDAFLVDSAVTHIRINPKGAMNGPTSATFKFRVRVK